MKIIIAPDSFKESLTAAEVASCIEQGFLKVFPDAEIQKIPMADGGEGSMEALISASNGTKIDLNVIGPLGNKVSSAYGLSGDRKTAFIEMAMASGLELLTETEKNPAITTSYGTGELIAHALSQGVDHVIVCLGGSATNDAGVGMMQALGVRFLNNIGQDIGFGGLALNDIDTIDISQLNPKVHTCLFEAACDVDNPLTGPKGASAIFGPQKGADRVLVATLDKALGHFAERLRSQHSIDIEMQPGAGAAGGLGASLAAFLNAQLRSGIEIVSDALSLKDAMKNADLVITGEGRMDSQSVYGKVPFGVASLAKAQSIPVFGIAGSLGDGHEILKDHGITALFSVLNSVCTLNDALKNAGQNLIGTAENIALVWAQGKQSNTTN